jgi:hypothetical protein
VYWDYSGNTGKITHREQEEEVEPMQVITNKQKATGVSAADFLKLNKPTDEE